ncbi:HD domain-containing protein [Pseudonocardia sp. KRD-184]|uniref:HD domain-containing protein n=1 Tax=Pseudonocardia oceani TaxID=2792013 RepID=A0ABS6U8X4_9PSEU|nr:HD domain-containing phosphohydrolase [Pseudonocardia oceani]MBW0092140.1 HD domain-containing protein [Pseudonocardia oceani]MBW0098028.1 HD domain-containing protein [Pseudonocardia oceani]MBW0111621.1 HD domain-containing protein [Pseudonocardia oceani]MBW0124018.1 HD domain-containing protein [Pseudonocardia oceani]MBW0128690.1 HD domain-containing protein [Pseudonocardia oceani]
MPPAGSAPVTISVSELVGMLSLAADLGLGQPMEHLARSCLIATRFAGRIGLTGDDVATTYSLALLAWVGCTADSHETAARFGDDIALRAGVYDVEIGSPPMLAYLVRRAGAGGPVLHRARVAGELIGTGGRVVRDSLVAHCQVTGQLAVRLGLPERLRRCLTQTFTRWDGRGSPAGVGGSEIDVATRIVRLADVVEVHHRTGGVDAALEVTRRRRGSTLDPGIADAFARHGRAVLDGLPSESSWPDLLAADPAPRPLGGSSLDAGLEAVADFVDLKSPYFAGRSRGVADLAAAAARRAGLPPGDVLVVRRAGLLQGLGRSGVPNTIWDKPGPLTDIERERVELHSYYTDRMLRRVPALGAAATVAAMAHERCDGSGYHRGLTAASLPTTARLLGAADCYHAMTETRAHRRALEPGAAAVALRAEATAGRLDPAAVEAVLGSAGHPTRRPAAGPAGLTAREVQVLELLARAATTRRIGRELGISPKTAGNHIERIYAKIGASTRAGAALFAVQHGLLRTLEPLDG